MNKQPIKTFITVNKLINGLNDKDLLNDIKTLKVLFDDYMEADYFNKKVRDVRVLQIKAVNKNNIVKDIDINEIFNIAGNYNVWLNVSTQLNNVKFPLVKRLNELSIDVKPIFYKTANGEITFHKITYINKPDDDKNKRLMSKLNNELSKKTVEHFNKKYSSGNDRDDSDFFDY
jgi:hypothetical protein